MQDVPNTLKPLERVKFYLTRAIVNRNKGKNSEAENDYLQAAMILLQYSIKVGKEARGRNINRARDILDNLMSTFHENFTVSVETEKRPGWKILNEIGISESRLSNTSLEDVAGLLDVKEEILRRLIYPIKFRTLSEKYGVNPSGGVLLFGPPGTGKTFLARAIANEAGATFININPSVLYNQWFGEFEKNISRVFKAARLLSPSVIFFDEIETIASSRGDPKEDAVSRRGVSQLLIEMEGIDKSERESIFILAATNRPWDLDDAILRPGRFDIQIYTPLPDSKARKKMFKLYLDNLKFQDGVDMDGLAETTQGYSGADISYICRRVRLKAFARSVENGKEILPLSRDILSAIEEVKPSVSVDTLKLYERFSSYRDRV